MMKVEDISLSPVFPLVAAASIKHQTTSQVLPKFSTSKKILHGTICRRWPFIFIIMFGNNVSGRNPPKMIVHSKGYHDGKLRNHFGWQQI